ncbi:MAG: energy-coupling factor ABC transporter ATP-binding protein [Spirochaetaceae bacterium]|jgi:biotin transport system ATP-binding protein|nr:energy-coupling factor ABC transporter ATP-binding protein [Spirochaetaceae bacterium]
MDRNPLFSIRRISKIFPSGHAALSGVDMEIEAGLCLVIAGANGSGKTVLMKIITGLADASSGEVFFEGVPLDRAVKSLRQSVGLVFQDADTQIIGETVAEDTALGPKNLKLPKNTVDERVSGAIKAAGLEGKADFPARSLSGGEKRRLAVAGILAMGCQTIIMDEPFANLDWPGVRSVLQIVAELKRDGKTVIILTHELEKTLAFADRLVIICGGRVVRDGEPEAVLDGLKPEYGVRDPRCVYRTVKDCSWL